MSDTETFNSPAEPSCQECGAPLAGDQRYCLNCGGRRPEARMPFRDVLGPAGGTGGAGGPAPGTEAADGTRRTVTSASPGTVLAGLALAVLVLGVGILVGRSGQASTGKPPVVNVNGGGGAPVAATPTSAFASDWPQGKAGWTIQLQTLPKTSTQAAQVAAAKAAAQGKGLAMIGALDSDRYPTLSPGQYVVYSGVYDTQKQAQAQLATAKKGFPTALVVQVSTSGSSGSTAPVKGTINLNGPKQASGTLGTQQLQQLKNASPAQHEKLSLKLPDVTSNGGTPPPKDNKPASGPTSVIR